jgi:hypothetical protein
MAVIIDMEMPKSCALCPMTYKDEVDYHICALIGANIDYLDKNEIHPDCPLKEIVTCKDCNEWGINKEHKDIDGAKFCSVHRIYTGDDFHCGDGERRE